MLPGGPGQSWDALVPLAGALGGVRRNRDIVLIDPRGGGKSAPLHCAALRPRDASTSWRRRPRRDGGAALHRRTAGSGSADVGAVHDVRRRWPMSTRYGLRSVTTGSISGAVRTERASRRSMRVGIRSTCAASCSTAPRRRRCGSGFDPWPSREAALDDVTRRVRGRSGLQAGVSRPRRDAGADQATLGPDATITIADPRTGATRDVQMSFDMVDRRVAGARLCAGAGEPDPATHRARRRRRLRAADAAATISPRISSRR